MFLEGKEGPSRSFFCFLEEGLKEKEFSPRKCF